MPALLFVCNVIPFFQTNVSSQILKTLFEITGKKSNEILGDNREYMFVGQLESLNVGQLGNLNVGQLGSFNVGQLGIVFIVINL